MAFLSKKTSILIVLLLAIIVAIAFYVFTPKAVKDINPTDLYAPDSIPMMDTDSVTMLISDSGLIRYKVIAQTWLVFDRVKEPYSFFPDKVYMEQMDTLFNVITTVRADSAWNYDKKKLWKLRGNVKIVNSLDETFTSEELFWDQRKEKIYSVEYVNIQRPNKIDLGASGGFIANQQMTDFEFSDVRDTDLYIEEKEDDGEEM